MNLVGRIFILLLPLLTTSVITKAFDLKEGDVFSFMNDKETTDNGIKYLLKLSNFAKSGSDGFLINNITKETVERYFNRSKETKLIVHGWKNSCNATYGLRMTKAFVDTKRFNVICVDWSTVSLDSYPVARWDASYVGTAIASFLDRLFEAGVDPNKTHVVGHSLGAHVAGIAGLKSKHKVYRITGLDPAGPLFIVSEKNRLSTDSAEFVDVIHTCAHYLGLVSPLGHIDFYPNGGEYIQPGCDYDFHGSCSHRRSYEYYMESLVKPGSFLAMRCSDWGSFVNQTCNGEIEEMGENVNRNARGVYYLYTAATPPYGLGKDSIKPRPINKVPTSKFSN